MEAAKKGRKKYIAEKDLHNVHYYSLDSIALTQLPFKCFFFSLYLYILLYVVMKQRERKKTTQVFHTNFHSTKTYPSISKILYKNFIFTWPYIAWIKKILQMLLVLLFSRCVCVRVNGIYCRDQIEVVFLFYPHTRHWRNFFLHISAS